MITADMLARLRRMVAEPDSTTYTNDDLRSVIARYPSDDDNGYTPYQGTRGASPATQIVNPSWVPTYDLARAAAEVWTEKAAALSTKVDFSEDGQSVKLSQQHTQALAQAQYWWKRRRAGSIVLITAPDSRARGEAAYDNAD